MREKWANKAAVESYIICYILNRIILLVKLFDCLIFWYLYEIWANYIKLEFIHRN